MDYNNGNEDLYSSASNEGLYENTNNEDLHENISEGIFDEPKRHGKKIFFIGGFLILAVGLLIGMSYGFFTSPKNTYLNLETKALKGVIKNVEDFQKGDFGKLFAAQLDKNIKYEMDMSIDTEYSKEENKEDTFEALMENTIKDIYTVIDGAHLKMVQEIDYKNDYQKCTGEVYLMGEKIIAPYVTIDKNILIAKVPELYGKYLTIDTDNLEKIYDNLELTPEQRKDLPNKILTQKDLIEAIKPTSKEEKQLKNSMDNYIKIINKNLKDENFVKQNNVKLEYDEKTIDCDLIELSLTKQEFKTLTLAILEQVRKDKSTDIIFDKLEKIKKLYTEAGYEAYEEMPTKEDFLKGLDEVIANIEKETVNSDTKLVSRLYYNGNDVLKRHIFTQDSSGGELEGQDILNVITINNKTEKYYEIANKSYYSTTVYKDNVKVEKDKETHNIKKKSIYTSFTDEEDETVEEKDICKIVIDKSDKDDIAVEFFPGDGSNTWEAKLLLKKDSSKKSSADFYVKVAEERNSFIFKMLLSAEEGVKIVKDKIEENDTLNINNASKETLLKVVEEMGTKAMEIGNRLQSKLPASLINAFGSIGAPMVTDIDKISSQTQNSIQSLESELQGL